MTMKLNEVVPFGRSLDEYRLMFDLADSDLDKKLIGVADGPASVNAEMLALGKYYKSVDPLYNFNPEQIENRFEQVVDGVIA